MIAYFDRFQIKMTRAQAESASHPGPCDEDVKALLQEAAIKRQFAKIAPQEIAEELLEWGAWDKEELTNEQANRERILWIAAGNIHEELADSNCRK